MNWLSQLIERLFCWVPRITLVAPDEYGIIETLGKRWKRMPPGCYIWWPPIQRTIRVTVTPQVVNLPGQSAYTKDGTSIVISGALQYRIDDAAKSILEVQDFDDSLRALSLGIISIYANSKTLKECMDIDKLCEEILKGIRKASAGWGIKIMRVLITDLAPVQSYRIIGNANVVPIGGR